MSEILRTDSESGNALTIEVFKNEVFINILEDGKDALMLAKFITKDDAIKIIECLSTTFNLKP